MKLVIAEKPSLGRAIQSWLINATKVHPQYNDYKVTWLFGHMLEIAAPEVYDPKWKSWDIANLPIIPVKFKLNITNNSGIKAQVAKVKSLVNECSEIIHAGDPDREGQLLVDELLEFFNNKKPVSRLWLAAIDDKSIAKAFNTIKPNSEYLGYKLAAEARSRADWLIGMNYSRAFSHVFKNKGYPNTISIGRVQTPTLKLITDRDNEIKNFVSKNFYELFATFAVNSNNFKAKLVLPEEFKINCDEDGRLLDKQTLETISSKVNNKTGIVSNYNKETKTINQPLLFNLSELQSVANNKFGYSAQEVLDLAQTLYENKLTTYPRSDCRYLPESQFIDAASIIKALLNIPAYSKYTPDSQIKSLVWNDKKITAHHAIIPTGTNLNCIANLKEHEKNVFDLIVTEYIMQFYPATNYEQIDITIDVDNYQFKTNLQDHPKLEKEGRSFENNLPENSNNLFALIKNGQHLNVAKSDLIIKQTQIPKPYTEGNLIKAMENVHSKIDDLILQKNLDADATLKLIKFYKSTLRETSGLGTEATRAGIIETLKKHGFVKIVKKNIIATELGHLLIECLTNNKTINNEFGFLTNALITAEYEQVFDDIQHGNSKSIDFLKTLLYPELAKLKNFSQLEFNLPNNSQLISCPSCNKGYLSLKAGTKGKFWGCSEYKTGCTTTFSDNNGQPLLITTPKTISKSTNEKCPKCNTGYMVQRIATFGAFKACNNYPKCKFIDKIK